MKAFAVAAWAGIFHDPAMLDFDPDDVPSRSFHLIAAVVSAETPQQAEAKASAHLREQYCLPDETPVHCSSAPVRLSIPGLLNVVPDLVILSSSGGTSWRRDEGRNDWTMVGFGNHGPVPEVPA